MPRDDPRDELLRHFDAAISGMGLDDLRGVSDSLARTATGTTRPPARPELRRPPRADVVIYRLHLSLDDSAPSIWRRLDVRSDTTLDAVHEVIQAAFGWTNSHLHRFSIGGLPFDWTSQVFLCPFDVDDGEFDDAGSPADSDVRLDEVLGDSGDELHYVYDYGDAWDVTLRLEAVLSTEGARRLPLAAALDGERAAPPENSGGVWALENMAEVVPDPALFDIDAVHAALRGANFTLRERNINRDLMGLAERLRGTRAGDDLAPRMLSLASEATELGDVALGEALAAHQFFLDRAVGGGIALTPAGYLRPEDVETASLVVPTMRDWPGKTNREQHTRPLQDFRESLQATGLLRKFKGALLLTRAGAEAQRNPRALWSHLAARLVRRDRLDFVAEANLLVLAYAGTSANDELPLETIAAALTELGWVNGDGRAIRGHLVYGIPAFDTLVNISERPLGTRRHSWISPAAATLARAALRRSPSA